MFLRDGRVLPCCWPQDHTLKTSHCPQGTFTLIGTYSHPPRPENYEAVSVKFLS